MTDTQSALRLWRDHDSNTAYRAVNSTRFNKRDEKVSPIRRDKVRIAIRQLKSEKASCTDGLTGELLKAKCW